MSDARGPHRLGDFIKTFLRKNGLDREAARRGLQQSWNEAVGAGKLLSHTRPGTVRSGILRVEVDSAVVLQEANFRRREIVKKLTELMPQAGIRDVRFVVGNFRSPE